MLTALVGFAGASLQSLFEIQSLSCGNMDILSETMKAGHSKA